MAKLPPPIKIRNEDFPKLDWMPQLLAPINRFVDDVIRSLNKQLTVTDNMDGALLTVIVDGTYPLDVKWTGRSLPKAAWIGQCRETTGDHTNFTNPLFLDWGFTADGLFRINNITGLTASGTNKFTVTIVAIAG